MLAMNKKYGKLVFGDDTFQHGLELCLWKSGIKADVVNEKTAVDYDVVFISLFFYRNIYEFEWFLRNSGLKKRKKKPILICGGMQATVTPEIVAEMCDYVFIGDAENSFTDIKNNIEAGKSLKEIPGMYWSVKEEIPEPICVDKLEPFWLLKKDGGQGRVEISRGCKHKCKFCMLSKLKPYRELDYSDIKKCVLDMKGKGVKRTSLFAPERTEHTSWNEIQSLLMRLKMMDTGSDARLEHLHRIKNRNKATFGLEGISYKLRKEVGKPFKEDFIINKMKEFTERQMNISFLWAYFIADLPGENEDDWKELYEFFCRIESEKWSRRLTFAPVLNPLSPKPFTEYHEKVMVHPFRDYHKRWINFLRKDNIHWGFRVIETNVWGSFERVLDAIAHYSGKDGYGIISTFNSKYLKKNPPKAQMNMVSRKILNHIQNKFGIKPESLYLDI